MTTAQGEAVRISAIAAGGEGVGRLADGRAVFIPRTAPGDLVEAVEVERKARFARARPGRLIEPGPDRVAPRCVHYDRDQCGGCQLQHLSSRGQREVRSAVVGEALRRLARLETPNPGIEPSDVEWGYRTRLTLGMRAGGRVIGLHKLGQPDRLFDLERCEIAAEELNTLWAALSGHRGLLPPHAERLVLRLARDGARHLIVEAGPGPAWSGAVELRRAMVELGQPLTIWWRPEGGAARVVSGESDAYPATAFEQVHPAMGDRVRRHALQLLDAARDQLVWDLYAGIGETTSALLEAGARVESVEIDGRAVSAAGPAVAPGVRRHTGGVEAVVGRLPAPDLIITNPPRTGMDAQVVSAIRRVTPVRLVYISCDPATLARDLARLLAPDAARPLRLSGVRSFDLFPQTSHVESVALLEAA